MDEFLQITNLVSMKAFVYKHKIIRKRKRKRKKEREKEIEREGKK